MVHPGTFNFGGKSPEEKERLKLKHSVEHTMLPTQQKHPCSREMATFIKPVIYGLNIGLYDDSAEVLNIKGGLSVELIQKLSEASKGDPELIAFLNQVYLLQVETYEANQKGAADSIAAAQSWDQKRLQTLDTVETALKQIRQDLVLQGQQQRRPGVFSKDNIDTWKFLSLEDSLQSRENLHSIILKTKKEISKIDSQITELREGMRPIAEEIAALNARL